MSDDQKTPPEKSFTEKAAKFAAIGAGVIAAAAVIPQDELMKTGLPNFWESIKGIAKLNWLRIQDIVEDIRPVAYRWLRKLRSVITWWALIALALIVGGIHVKTAFGSNVGHVLVAAGTVSFAGLGILVYALCDGIALILYMKFKIAGNVARKATSLVGVELPEVLGRKDLEDFRDKVRMVLAGTTVLCFSMLFTMFFPAWSTLGWTLCFWALVSVALVAALHLNLKMGKAIKAVFYLTIGLVVAMFVVFLLDRLTGGALGFGGFQKWLLKINGSELLVAFLVLVPVALLLVGIFTKDKDAKASYVFAAKYVGIGCGVLAAFLLYKGTISWQQLSGKDTEKDAVGKTVDVAHKKYMGALQSWEKDPETKSAPQGTTSNGGNYMAPPTGNAFVASPQTPIASTPVRARTGRASKPLPKEEPKKYSNLTQGMDDLEALGY